MIAFVYLTCRLQRSAIIPSDMIRWCESGLIPYSGLYDVIPDSYKVEAVILNRVFFTSCWSRTPYFLSPKNVLVMTAGLADSLDLKIPPLNAPLVAKSIIDKLGMIGQVKHTY